MKKSVELLEEAIALAEQEVALMESEDDTGALEESVAKRQILVESAWNEYQVDSELQKVDDAYSGLYEEKLLELQSVHQRLRLKGTVLYGELQNSLKQHKVTSSGIGKYRTNGPSRKNPRVFSFSS